ncbi:NAD(P)-dependent oxidoreductase [Agromyces albus]|uniref:NAD-dependent epimerase/dehydratase family protein n=1 Tax=Agromyces albus TaxID=205332 RepID=A0A4Q2L060_9MICO|nr:NAD(P)H-binding protein [Agromyces albus]RXZ70749.1 NAD-dependent epimerase/dehydratase family protein [Agromyces albus]
MNITVFGATGAIGALTVNELLTQGHTVTADARNRKKVPSGWGDDVRVVVGEISDRAAIHSAIDGADVVVSALGPDLSRKAQGLPLVEGTRHILDSMTRHGVKRYIGHATPSILDPQEKPTAQTRMTKFLGSMFLPRASRELVGMIDQIMASGIDWTIIRFTAPKNTPKTGRVRAGFFGTDKIGAAVSRADIAAFTASQVSDDTYLNRAPAISN